MTHEPCKALFTPACCGKCDTCEQREVALKRAGAIEALESLKKHLFDYAIGGKHEHPDEIYGLQFAHREIQERINSLEAPVEAGGEFPTGYFQDLAVAQSCSYNAPKYDYRVEGSGSVELSRIGGGYGSWRMLTGKHAEHVLSQIERHGKEVIGNYFDMVSGDIDKAIETSVAAEGRTVA